MTQEQPAFTQINLIVANMEATIAFYRRLGLDIDANAGGDHVAVETAGGMLIEFDRTSFVGQWDSGWRGSTGGSTVLGFALASRDGVDERYAALTLAGHRGRQPPYDAFWGARYAIVEDPDGNAVGLMSPIEKERKFWPPAPLPTGDA